MKIVSTMRNKLLVLFLLISVLPILFNWFVLVAVQLDNHSATARQLLESGLRSSLEIIEEQTRASVNGLPVSDAAEKAEELFWVKRADVTAFDAEGPVAAVQGTDGTVYVELDTQAIARSIKWAKGRLQFLGQDEGGRRILEELRKNSEDTIIIEAVFFDGSVSAVGQVPKAVILEKDIFWTELVIRSSLIMMIVTVCLSYVVSYRYTEGMEQLADDVKRMRKGDFGDVSRIEGNDEIASLSHSFHIMAEEMDTLVNRTLRLTISERNAKIRAMQSQISSHFLYNALDSVNWNLLKKGDFESSQILVSLSAILRYSTDDTKELVSVKEEFAQAENYLMIQNSRFSDRFSYSIHLEEAIEETQIPKMILQPLVENAISHGLEDGKNGLLELRGREIPGGVEIRIYDNGKGIEADRLDLLLRKMNESGQIADENDFHLGLANVHNRLRYRYGKNSGLFIDSVEGEYTVVAVKILTGGDV